MALMFTGTIKVAKGRGINTNPNVQAQAVIDAYDTLTMPTVCVWEPLDGIGHSSVFIKAAKGVSRALDTTGYASWFPGDEVGRSGVLPGRMVESELSSFFEDCELESGNGQNFRLPEHMIQLPHVNSFNMLAAWTAIRNKPGSHYRVMRKNCSTIAARVIRAGLNTSQHFSVLKKAHQPWWTPNDVLKLALAL